MNVTVEASTVVSNGQAAADRYVTVAGVRLRYRDQGRGPAVLLVHGWTLDLEIWEPQVAALSRSFRVIRLDRRGFGRSGGQPRIEQDVTDIEALRLHLGLKRLALIGMSQGIRSVLSFASHTPALVSCLVLDGPPDLAAGGAGDSLSLEPYRQLVRAGGMAAFREQWLRHPLMQLRCADAGARRLLRAIIERYPGHDLMAAPIAAAGPAMAAALDSLPLPVLIVTGELDLPARVHSADSLARQLPHAERAVIARGGHLSNLDNPECYNQLVTAFLMRHAQPA
ncbi:MAG: alpha/beta fold hydrolase [Steroidobacteraceae bacterium]